MIDHFFGINIIVIGFNINFKNINNSDSCLKIKIDHLFVCEVSKAVQLYLINVLLSQHGKRQPRNNALSIIVPENAMIRNTRNIIK